MIMSYFLDKDGVFMWSSVAAIVSGIVLIFQFIQFFYQKKEIKKLKKFDVMIDFRITDLKELKRFIINTDEYLQNEIIKNEGKVLETGDSLIMLLNVNNKRRKVLLDVFQEYTLLLARSRKEEYDDPNVFLEEVFKMSERFIKEYKLYEDEEIKMIEEYI